MNWFPLIIGIVLAVAAWVVYEFCTAPLLDEDENPVKPKVELK